MVHADIFAWEEVHVQESRIIPVSPRREVGRARVVGGNSLRQRNARFVSKDAISILERFGAADPSSPVRELMDELEFPEQPE